MIEKFFDDLEFYEPLLKELGTNPDKPIQLTPENIDFYKTQLQNSTKKYSDILYFEFFVSSTYTVSFKVIQGEVFMLTSIIVMLDGSICEIQMREWDLIYLEYKDYFEQNFISYIYKLEE